MKRGSDELLRSECFHPDKQRKSAAGEFSSARLEAEAFASGGSQEEGVLCTEIEKQGASASSHKLTAVGDDLQSRELGGCKESAGNDENTSLLCHQDPQVRLRALACLYAHIDLLTQDSEGTERLFQALHSRLLVEDNVHVTQQIVRLLASLVIYTCKFGGDQKTDPHHKSNLCFGTNASSEHSFIGPGRQNASNFSGKDKGANHSPHYDDGGDQLPLRRNYSIDPAAFWPIPEPAMQCVKMLLSYALTEIDSTTLKLQLWCSIYQITKETNAVQYALLQEHVIELLASSNPFIRAQTLQVVALSLVKYSERESVLGEEDVVAIFLEYFDDSDVVVREAALHSIILLCSNGYLLTERCHQAAVTLFEDSNKSVRSLALQVVSLWVKQDPRERTDIAFLEVCKMMTDMELSVRIETCRSFLTMKNVREDLLLQALTKQPLELSNEVKEPQPSSLITISETDVDISKYPEGLNILDRLYMGAFVHGIEDEFSEVRALTLSALTRFCSVSTRARAAIVDVMVILLNDDSNVVRLKAVEKMIQVAEHYGIQINDNNLQLIHGILEDIDLSIRDAGKTLLVVIQHSSEKGLKSTIERLMKFMHRHEQEKDVWCVFYKLGRANSNYVQLLAKDLLKELKGCLSAETGLDAPECACILNLLVGAAETNTKILSLVPLQIISLAQVIKQSKFQSKAVLEMDSVDFQGKVSATHLRADVPLALSSEHKIEIEDFVAGILRTSWNVKQMLHSGMLGKSTQVLRGCRRDMKRLINTLRDEDQVALTTYSLHYVECIYLLVQGWVHFQHKEILSMASIPSLFELACRMDYVVKCMQHTYIGHTDEQKLDLLELSMIPALWRMTSVASRNDYRELSSAVEAINSALMESSSHTSFMENIQKNLFEAVSNSFNVQKTLHQLSSLFWPRLSTINSLMQEMKAVLDISRNDLEHPTEFLPDIPFGIPVSILMRNLDTGRIWVRLRLDSLWTKFMFLDAEECRKTNPLVFCLPVPGLPVYSKCTLEAAVYLECPGVAHEVVRGPRGFLLPLTPDKLIHLVPKSLG